MIHVDDLSNAVEFLNLTESFNLVQHISGSPHNRWHTLETWLLMTLSSFSMEDFVSDHKCI